MQVHLLETFVQNLSTDVVKVDVDAVWASLGERLCDIFGFVVNGRIKAELSGNPLTFLI